jgi:hypothetical protein
MFHTHILARIAAIALLCWVPLNLVDVKPTAAQVAPVSVEFRTALERLFIPFRLRAGARPDEAQPRSLTNCCKN